jgi:hypothetical protein
MKVSFNDLDEFLSELKRDVDASPPLIANRVVRTTISSTENPKFPQIRYHSFVSQYVRLGDTNDVIQLKFPLGDSLGNDAARLAVIQEWADKTKEKIRAVADSCAYCAIEVRPGFITTG